MKTNRALKKVLVTRGRFCCHISQTYEDGETVTYQYDESGFWTSLTDSATGITTTYTYDLEGRLRLYEEKGEGHDYSLKYSYTDNKLTYV